MQCAEVARNDRSNDAAERDVDREAGRMRVVRGDVIRAFTRFFIQGLDVLERVFEFNVAGLDLIRRQSVEHERVV